MKRVAALCLVFLAACSARQQQTLGEVVAPAPEQIEPATAKEAVVEVPAPNREPVVEKLHGVEVTDPFRWLENENLPAVKDWMAAQDKAAREKLSALPGREALQKRYAELYYLDSVSAPVKRAGRYFFTRTHKDKEKAILYWKEGNKGEEQVLLDPNAWSKDGTISLGRWVPSWDGKKVVFQFKPNAADEAQLNVIDVDSSQWSTVDVIDGGKYAEPSWTPDSRGFYYEWLPPPSAVSAAERPGHTELRFHKLGVDPKHDAVVHPRTGNPSTFLGGYLSRDGKYLFATIHRGWNENDVFFQRPGQDKEWRLLAQGSGALYEVHAWKDRFYVVTDEGAPNKRIFSVDPAKPERASWTELVPEDKNASLQDVSIVGGQFALHYLRNAASEVRLVPLTGKGSRKLELPGLGSSSGVVGLQDDDEVYYSFSSFTLPRQVFKASVKTAKSQSWFKVQVPVDPTPYVVEQVWYPSKDGTKVSMFIVRKKDLLKDGSAPALLYGYGGFDVSLTSTFTSFIYPWLEAGGIYAVPNLRGGGEYGKAWHDAGRGRLKQNVFDDFIAAAHFLIKDGYTRPERLAIRGGSNGGLLVGASMTQKPELFGAVICAVPLLDMVRYPLFGSGKTWVPEYGDPAVAEDFAALYAYSPYHQIKEGTRYPRLLMMSADHDDRVDPMHARKFVARVQKAAQADAWLRIESNAGHGGADQVRRNIEASADQIAFLMNALGVQGQGTSAAK